MKKIVKILIALILVFVALLTYDRYKNVNVENNDNGTTALFFGEGIFVKIPEEQWIEIDREEFKPASIHLFVEKYNPIFHTWDNTLQSLVTYHYLDPKTSFTNTLFISESVAPYEMANIRQVLYENTIDNVEIIYGSQTHTDYVLQLTKDEKIVNITFDIDDLNYLMPLFESIFEDIKK